MKRRNTDSLVLFADSLLAGVKFPDSKDQIYNDGFVWNYPYEGQERGILFFALRNEAARTTAVAVTFF